MSGVARPARRIVVIVNAGSGTGHDDATSERLRGLFEEAGAAVEIRRLEAGADLAAEVQAAMQEGPDVIVAGGGDGTVSGVAAALVDREITLGVLPLGTLNHFAKDLGIPLDLAEAVRTIVEGHAVSIDVGEVNGRVFINNSSLGLYPDIVRDREHQQKRLGRGKWLALAWAGLAALRRFPFIGVRLTVDGSELLRRTPFVFIGNNEYRMEGFAIGQRSRLDQGRLSLYVAQRPGRLRLLQLALRALVGRLHQARDFQAMLAGELVVETSHRRLRVATDGEITLMTPPLLYRVRPACLRVMRGPDDPASQG
ncbi:MAG: diacylglycerol kinase family protein [Caldimonas sp.]